jgi:hypothetical protein
MILQTVIARFIDRPAYQIFLCDSCDVVDWVKQS